MPSLSRHRPPKAMIDAHMHQKQDENLPTSTAQRTNFRSLIENIKSVPRTSTPARPPRPHRAPKPVKRAGAANPSLPPSSPPSHISRSMFPDSGTGYEGFVDPEPLLEVPTNDDPFGFLAAERRLAKRKRILPSNLTNDKSNIEQAKVVEERKEEDKDDADDGRPAFATPPQPIQDDYDNPELDLLDLSTLVSVSGLQTPPGHTPVPRPVSPRHRRPKRKEIPSSSSSSSRSASPVPGHKSHDEMLSILLSPSPLKHISSSVPRQRRPFADIAARVNSPLKTATIARETLKVKAKGGMKKGSKSGPPRKEHKTDETLAEEELKGITDELKELLPRRPTRSCMVAQAQTQTRAQKKNTKPVKSVTRKTRSATKTKTSGKKVHRKKPRSKKTNTKTGGGNDEQFHEKEGESFVLSGEEREQFEVAREKRKEYFRQVDDYVMDEESIYII